MANRWTRKAETPRTVSLAADPLSNQLAKTVYDLRNTALVRQLTGGNEDDATIQALFKPIIAAVADEMTTRVKQGQTPKPDDINTIMTEHLKQRLVQKQIEALDGPPASANAPKDVMAFAEGAVNIQKAAADTAMSVAATERELRHEAEQNAAGMADYARHEEQQKANQTIEIIREMNAVNMGMLEKVHATELQFKDYQLNTTVTSITKATEDAIARITSASETAIALKEQLHQKDLENIQLKHEKEKAEMKSALPPSSDPQYLYHMSWVRAQDEDRQAARIREQAEHENRLKMYDWVREEVGPKALDAFGNAIKQIGGGLSVDNASAAAGVPARPPSAPGIGGAE